MEGRPAWDDPGRFFAVVMDGWGREACEGRRARQEILSYK